jgi:hypothetical protein
MKRRTLDLVFVVGGVLLATLLGVLGLVMKANADFAKDYVRDQLSEQKITFTAAEFLSDGEKASACLNEYAGTPLDSGKKAECYANDYIGFHLRESATEAGYEGATYATLGGVTRGINAELKAATEGGQPTDEIQGRLDEANGLRETMFKGETLRGLLLTSYGFSVFGVKGEQVMTVAFIAALVLLLASLAGLVHFARTPKDKVVHFGHPDPDLTGSSNGTTKQPVPVSSS